MTMRVSWHKWSWLVVFAALNTTLAQQPTVPNPFQNTDGPMAGAAGAGGEAGLGGPAGAGDEGGLEGASGFGGGGYPGSGGYPGGGGFGSGGGAMRPGGIASDGYSGFGDGTAIGGAGLGGPGAGLGGLGAMPGMSGMPGGMSGGMGGFGMSARTRQDLAFQQGLISMLDQLKKSTDPEEKKVLLQYAREAFAKRYQEQLKEREATIESLEQKLVQLKQDHKRRSDATERIVDLQMKSLDLVAEGLLESQQLLRWGSTQFQSGTNAPELNFSPMGGGGALGGGYGEAFEGGGDGFDPIAH